MWVAIRSRKKRSWLMTTAQPGKSSSAASRPTASRHRDHWWARRAAADYRPLSTSWRGARDCARRPKADRPSSAGPALEVEPAAHKRGCSPPIVAELHDVEAARDLLPHGFLGLELRRGFGRRIPASRCRRAGCRPPSGCSTPVSILNSVVLPAPFGPITPTMPPGGSLKDKSSISSRSPKAFDKPPTSSTTPPSLGPGGI